MSPLSPHLRRTTWVAAILSIAACSPGGSAVERTDPPAPVSGPTTSASPEATAEPVLTTTETDCPYLATADVEGIVGQKTPTVLVTTSEPALGPVPACEFRKPNGEPAARVETRTATSVTDAQQQALAFAPGGNPVQAGDGGSVLVDRGAAHTLLGAYQGTVVVLVTINQESSLEATSLATAVLASIA